MRRDPALQDLSRDHHAILLLAQRLRRADLRPEETLGHLRGHVPPLLLHFQEEENLVFPHVAGADAERLRADHDALRAEFRDLGVAGTLAAARLVRLGERIRDHVRAEEAAFDRLQRDLGRGQIATLGEALTQFRRRHRPGAIGPEACDFPAVKSG